MNRRTTVLAISILAVGGFAAAGYIYKSVNLDAPTTSAQESTVLVRSHSPVLGPANARVTIVEFFDPACEACRAFYPIVKQIMAQYPDDVRVVLRYTPLHKGSDVAVRILETARLQNVFEPVLEAVLAKQPEWASHSGPQLDKAWAAAEAAGLNLSEAKETMSQPSITTVLTVDISDAQVLRIAGTPTFFVNGKQLLDFGPQGLSELVKAEVSVTK